MITLSETCLCPFLSGRRGAGLWLLGAAVLAHVTQVSRCHTGRQFDPVGGAKPPGHLQPLGSHRPPEGDVFYIPGFMKPERFFEDYLRPGLPVLFKGAAKMSAAFDKWDDQYLKDNFGELIVEVEYGKKENRTEFADEFTLSDFLDEYGNQDIYMVQDAFEEMYGDIGLPRPLNCGGAGNLLNTVVLWLSSGGTKSVLHYDDLENINCLLSGTKDLVLIDREYGDLVEADGWMDSYSKLDVDSVDMYAFPEMRHVPWWRAHMDAGDCLYIPMGWYHHVHSWPGSRNFAMNFWFHQNIYFNNTSCDLAGPTNDFTALSPTNFIKKDNQEFGRYFMFIELTDLEDITLQDLNEAWSELLDADEIHEVFTKFDTDGDNVLSWPEVQEADMEWMAERFGIMDSYDEDETYHDPEDLRGMPAWDVEKKLREEL